jgi:hypothetical protein
MADYATQSTMRANLASPFVPSTVYSLSILIQRSVWELGSGLRMTVSMNV